ncbi:hypothetical protein BJ138DRAFT_1159285 [Hygrophoropsis aurantiaca]|uniref:Uncharacterized protein n=1 Tax=Hygrophoropsis aurantiaca TaxID=72124 RepID=A0ACB8A3H2_9AGAM|nr:hypothetical protein BJ138DRAFT_1159285 [Hygrophoropsis aurantiaca]
MQPLKSPPMVTATLPLIPNDVYRIRSGNPSNANAYLERQADGSVIAQPSKQSSDSQKWTISLAADGDYTITSVSNPSEGILHINDINELECGTARRPASTWTIEPRGRDTYVIGYTANALAINLPRQSQPVAVSSRNVGVIASVIYPCNYLDRSQNRVNQRWILGPNPLQSASIPGTVAANPRYTSGTQGKINVQNNLKVPVYVAVSDSNRQNSASQFPIDAGSWDTWSRGTSETVHVSTRTSLGSFRSYNGRVGFTVHIDDPIPDAEWRGVTSVATTNVRYTSGSSGQIRVQNDLDFAIYVVVLDSAVTASDPFLSIISVALMPTQILIRPGQNDSWAREGSEIVLVSMASTPGFVRAYHGRWSRGPWASRGLVGSFRGSYVVYIACSCLLVFRILHPAIGSSFLSLSVRSAYSSGLGTP